ncbi:MAG: ABC transporter substrate-binding protein [Alphaproteobacteria bacterium]|nr:ABC transporter substrate-binding protein [Alphaproteobacteria bacterium]
MASRSLCVMVRAALLLVLLVSPLAHASSETEATAALNEGQQQNDTQAFIQNLGDKAISILANKDTKPEDRDQTFRTLMYESFDLPTIARFVIGRNAWNGATQQEKDEYLKLFEQLVIHIYSDRFAMYSGEIFKVMSDHVEGERDSIVTSHIQRPESDQPIVVDWRVRNFEGRLAIIDVIVEGISMSVSQRQEYSSVLQRNENNIEPLLKLMRDSLEKQDKADSKEAADFQKR